MKNVPYLILVSILILFFASCNNDNVEKTKLSVKDLHSRGDFAPVVYTTTGDGTWTGANWSPAPPPNNMTNVAVVINHTIDYTTTVGISNWNKSDLKPYKTN